MKMSKAADQILEELKKPIPEHHLKKRKEKSMAAPKKKTATRTKAKASTKASAPKPTAKDEDLITLNDLADEAGITASKARQRLRAAEIEKDEGQSRWVWSPKSKSLKAVRAALAKAE